MLNHEQKFPSKKGFVIYIPLLILLAVETGYLIGGLYVGAVLVFAVMAGVFFPVFFNTYYAISADGILRVKCGLFFNTKIAIAEITRVENTKTILSAPALSTDRIEVFYNKFASVVISPDNKAMFVAELQKINPGIGYQ